MTKQAEPTISPFQRLSQINVNEHVEKKNGLSYLSWAWAISELFKADPDANWEFHAPQMFGETMMVSCTVRAFGKPIMMHLPVMDHRNQAIKNPDAFAVNKNMMRCLVKAIACHGLGIYLYAGEDLPENEAEAFAKKAVEKGVTPGAGATEGMSDEEIKFLREVSLEADQCVETGGNILAFLKSKHLETEEKVAVLSMINSKTRSAIKKARDTAEIADSIAAQA